MSVSSSRPLARKIGLLCFRIVMVAIFAIFVTTVLRRSDQWVTARGGLAGFGSGMLHGALMPGAMPALALGRDVPIYSAQNNGIPYKLGYTVGVNVCGAIFFGWTFWRVNRWRKKLQQSGPS
jgi:hypothetical protein